MAREPIGRAFSCNGVMQDVVVGITSASRSHHPQHDGVAGGSWRMKEVEVEGVGMRLWLAVSHPYPGLACLPSPKGSRFEIDGQADRMQT